MFDELLDRLPDGAMLLGDRAYDADKIRTRQVDRSGWANIPPKRTAPSRSCSALVSTASAI